MPATLATLSENFDEPFDGLLASILSEQQDLTAVERFAQWHNRTAPDHLAAFQTPALAKHYSSLMPATAPSLGEQYAFEVDLDACSGCKACVVACHNLNGLESDETWRKVGWLTSHDGGLPIVQHVTTACHHCVEPGCLSGCPVKAYEKDPLTGIVRHLDDQCFGCKYCTMMCPYEVPQYSATLGIVRKCDMCSQRIGGGEAPACVQACPNEAIRITLVQSMKVREMGASTTTTLLPTAPPSQITLPTTTYLSTRNSLTSSLVSYEAVIDHPHEGHWPLVAMLVLTQASVGMWCVLSLLLLLSSSRPLNEFFWIATIAATIGVVGVHLALAHLGRPWLAFRAFLGWRTSWLSREAIAFAIYMAVASLTTLGFVAQLSSYTRLLVVLSAAVGLVAVACSAMIYVATRRSLWSGQRTAIEFAATTFGLGMAFVSMNEVGPFGTRMLLLGSIFAGFGMVAKFYDRQSGRQSASFGGLDWKDFSKRSGRLLNTELSRVWMAAWMTWLNAVIVSTVLCMGFVPIAIVSSLGGVTVALLLVSQLLNRWLYFASIVTYRMPGAST